jgi:fatty acid synthase
MFTGGILLQKVGSCLEMLDGFMKQPHPIVASMIVADKSAGSGVSDNLTACVASIMGMSNITKLSKICQQLMYDLFSKLYCGYNP